MVEAYDTDGEVLWQALWGPGLDELVEFRNVARDGPGAPPLLALTDFRRSVVGFVTADEHDALAVEGFVEYGPWGAGTRRRARGTRAAPVRASL
jgi:hypothetical protein